MCDDIGTASSLNRNGRGLVKPVYLPALYTKHANEMVARWKLRQDKSRVTFTEARVLLFLTKYLKV